MPWLRTGDNAASHPIVSAVREHPLADDRLKLEAYGFFVCCAQSAAAWTTDYVISRGTALDLAGSTARGEELIAVCLFAGYFTDEQKVDGRTYYTLVNDPEFIHMRTREEIDWEKQRKLDNSNYALTVPVRVRDGDACRYCGHVVNFGARTGGRAGTYDHREPGQPGTVDTVVVCCRACNAGRKDDPRADDRYPLLPPPSEPYYSDATRKWLTGNTWATANGYRLPERPGIQPDPAQPRPDTPSDTAPGDPSRGIKQESAGRLTDRRVGSGRVGTGSQDGAPRARGQDPQPPRKKRGRRGRGGTSTPNGGDPPCPTPQS